MQLLKVSDNRRFLVHADGTPFFWLGDTAWELLHRCDREETELYLTDRASKRFTVIQTVVLAENDGLHTPNSLGEIPLHDDDPTRPNEAYFQHVDWVIQRAGELGLYIALLPTWGDKWNLKWGVGPEIFTPENATAYGEWLGKRYKDTPNIIWILGGDRPVENESHAQIVEGMARGIERGDEGKHLMSLHPPGQQTSAAFFHEADWLDFNMYQTGHNRDKQNYVHITSDYARTPVKPCLDGEPDYENIPNQFKQELGYFDDYDVRNSAYWALFSGAFGHTYGCSEIWQMWLPGREPNISALQPWTESLKLPGAGQLQYARTLMESRPFLTRIPDQSVIVEGEGEGGERALATRDSEGSYAFVYLPTGNPVTVDLSKLSGENFAVSWYNPRNGESTPGGEISGQTSAALTPPSQGHGQDWILVVDDKSHNFASPGK